MTTKLRSACDRCHSSKVRCSGDMPCQTCLMSKCLCFYSVSNPLGRPRGTKNANTRTRPSRNNSGRRHTPPEEEVDVTASEPSAVKRVRLQPPTGTTENHSEAHTPDDIMSGHQLHDAHEPLDSRTQSPSHEFSFASTVNNRNSSSLPDLAPSSDPSLDGSEFAYLNLQSFANPSSYDQIDYEEQLVTPVLDLACIDQPETWRTMGNKPAKQLWTGPTHMHSIDASKVCSSSI